MMQTVMVNASAAYPVHIGGGLLDRTGELIAAAAKSRRCAVVTDSNVGPLYGGRVQDSLKRAGFDFLAYTFPAGEQSKNLDTYRKILEFFALNHLTRSDFVIALGGGVAGDMAGFAAATYQRGVDYIQMPTTFLAASDSSVGGKTAVDLEAGKNLAGAFWQPRLVVCDTDTFSTLTEDAFADGAAETVKHALIADRDFLEFLMTADIRQSIQQVVRRNVEIKAAVVGEDEFEQRGDGKILFNTSIGPGFDPAAMEKWASRPGNYFFCDTKAAAGAVSEGFFNLPGVCCRNVSAGRTVQAFELLSRKVLDNIKTILAQGA